MQNIIDVLGMTSIEKSPYKEDIVKYVLEILNSSEYNTNPVEYMKNWQIKRGRTEKLRPIEDNAMTITWRYTEKVYGVNLSDHLSKRNATSELHSIVDILE